MQAWFTFAHVLLLAANMCLLSSKEKGVDNISLLPIFEPTVSPRNFVIVATKKRGVITGMTSNLGKVKIEDKIPLEQVK